jgi:hypothetical protein
MATKAAIYVIGMLHTGHKEQVIHMTSPSAKTPSVLTESKAPNHHSHVIVLSCVRYMVPHRHVMDVVFFLKYKEQPNRHDDSQLSMPMTPML